ncbi:hydrogenase maturation nickel metallochaperone HypA [Cytobacillus spongiae]|uniref:hydrogenase maturation nickel metallochaperone HypA/HybF n=1 Tax=Cytobacillus spongiae TaxID=2901381 RepID=UPI001F17BD95|nr:hydrogenase maturation nickel metallochaperone HypA [Cytobacillus spongiae]UII54513.1 hydrogenase maturation nickel metallochaperone HypA [Cytobacillus spongiae]
MHEMALMGDILEMIQEDCKKQQIGIIEEIDLIIGEISHVMPDAIQMAFEVYRIQNPHFIDPRAVLTIHFEKAEARCVICQRSYTPDQRISVCPSCHTPSGKIVSGETFQVLSYEGR